ncbi:MAG TPA: alpha/beta hydrolase [Kofleriaceae bacterium]|jgi:pimeloyl-ACP methyl ester carboxylesterase|nr:alpha/beta hydrolase [Kofleriaceae bacterium]
MRWTLEDARGQAMMVRRFGEGPEIVWIHGLGEWSLNFDPIAAHPAFAGFSHVMPDLPGYGRSPWPEQADGVEQLADRLASWIGDRRPALIGHSMGGALATLVAERIAVRAVVNVDGNLSRGDCTFSAKGAAYTPDDFAAFGFSALRAQIYDDGRSDLALRGYHAALCATSPRVYHRQALELVAMSESETLVTRLAALRVPALFVAGVPGGICAHSRTLLDRHAVRWVGIEPAGHWVHVDQPERFAAEVTGFLRDA